MEMETGLKRDAKAGDGVMTTLESGVILLTGTARAEDPERRKLVPNVRCLLPPKERRRKEVQAFQVEPGLASPSLVALGSWSCRRALVVVLSGERVEGCSGWVSEGNCRIQVFRIKAWMRRRPRPCRHSGHGWASEHSQGGDKGGSERRGRGDAAAGGRLGTWESSEGNWSIGRPEDDSSCPGMDWSDWPPRVP